MPENTTAQTLKVIGIIECICGIFIAILIWGEDGDLFPLAVALAVSSFITCMVFIGFSEVIYLLQKNADTQEKILIRLNNGNAQSTQAPNSVLQNIESNLPQL